MTLMDITQNDEEDYNQHNSSDDGDNEPVKLTSCNDNDGIGEFRIPCIKDQVYSKYKCIYKYI